MSDLPSSGYSPPAKDIATMVGVMSIESILSQAWSLQPPSATIIRLLDLIGDPDADFREAVATIECDSVLSAKLLARCNTVQQGLAQPLGSVKQCVLHLGYAEIHRLILSLSFGPQLGGELRGYDMAEGTLWQHSLTTARLTPKILSLALDPETDASIAYTAGLIHDIGKLVVAQLLNDKLKQRIHDLMAGKGKTLLEAEVATLGADHAEIGAELLDNWRLPGPIVEAVRHHHAPGKARPGKLAAAIHVANAVAHQVGDSPGWHGFAFTFDPSALATLRINAKDLEKLTGQVIDLGAAAGVKKNPNPYRNAGTPLRPRDF